MYKGNVEGKKGGSSPPPPRTPVEAENSLQSKSVARLFDLLSEGEIEGFIDQDGNAASDVRKGIYFDGTPLMANDGTMNFEGVNVEFRDGLPDQDPITGIADGVPTETSVDDELLYNVYHYANITNVNVDSVLIKITVPALSNTDQTTGDISPTSVAITVDVKGNSDGSYTNVGTISISGKCVSSYQRLFRVPIAKMIQESTLSSSDTPYSIRVKRTTADSTSAYLQNKTYWTSYIEVIEQRLIYPDTAYVGIEIDAEQFGTSIPARAYKIRGIKVQIPSNYNPTTRVYTGIWDGSFTTAWTDNPAWIYYDLLTQLRYGLGLDDTILPDITCKWDLYEIGQYCDGLVDDGYGSTEPRFTCNCVIADVGEAYHVLNMLASAFRAMPFWGTGQVHITQDSPKDPTRQVSPVNVENGLFVYEGSGLKARHSVALVSWNDPNDFYRLAIEFVEDDDAIARYGWNPIDITAFACTSRGQAHRLGKWILETEQYETETCSYVAGFDHVDCLPGEIIEIADPAYTEVRHGGRIKDVNVGLDQITLDAAYDFQAGRTYYLTVVQPYSRWSSGDSYDTGQIVLHNSTLYKSKTDSNQNHEPPNATYWEVVTSVLATKTVTNPATETDVVTLTSALPEAPQDHSVWILTDSTDVDVRQMRVVSNVEIDPHKFAITGLIHDPDKYSRVEDGWEFDSDPTPRVPAGELAKPSSIVVEEFTYLEGQNHKFGAIISWQHANDSRVSFYEVQIKDVAVGVYNSIGETGTNTMDVRPIALGDYKVRIRSVGFGGMSQWVESSQFSITADPNPLPTPQNLNTLEGSQQYTGTTCEITWTAVDDVSITDNAPAYSSSTTYAQDDMVEYEERFYVSLQNSNLNHPPDSSPTWWRVCAVRSSKLKDYVVSVYATGGGIGSELRTEYVTDNKYTYSLEKNIYDHSGTPVRGVDFRVWARDVYENESAAPALLQATNPAPDMSSGTPTVTALAKALKIDWTSITPSDSDILKYRVYCDKNTNPTTLVAEVTKETTKWIEWELDVEDTYYAKVIPYDEFGVGTASLVGNAAPTKLSFDDIEGELSANIEMSDSDSNSASTLAALYDRVTDSGGVAYTLSGTDKYVQYKFPVQMLVDRVALWTNNANGRAYIAYSDDGQTWSYLKAEADHTLDSDGELLAASSQSDAQTNYWQLASGKNVTVFPNGIAVKYIRLYFTGTYSTTLYELVFVRLVLAEQMIADTLAAISADLGAITAGSLNIGSSKFVVDTSGNVTIKSATTGARLEIYNDKIKVYDASSVLRVQLGDLS